MVLGKYRYYFRKPRSEITKDILLWLLVAGGVILSGSGSGIVSRMLFQRKSLQGYPKRNVQSMFSYLRKRELVVVEKHNHQIYLSLTDEGKKKAGMFQLQEFKIPEPKNWDKKWRILVFDIPEKKRVGREALRGMLKRLQFYQLQKSVWVHPFNCRAEVSLLKSFFSFTDNELRFMVAEEIGSAERVKQFFGLH